MKYAKLTLKGRYRETGSQVHSLAGTVGRDFRFDQFLLRVEKLLRTPRVRRVLIVCDPQFQAMLWGGAEAIRNQLQRLAESGKELWFYAHEYHPLQLYLASACTRRVLHPLGTVSFLGLSRSFLFFKKAMGKADIEAQIIRRGEYKSAGDRFRTDRLDHSNQEQYQEFFNSVAAHLADTIVAGYKETMASPEAARAALNELTSGRIISAGEAESEGWIHKSKTLDRLETEWKNNKYKKINLKKPGRSYTISGSLHFPQAAQEAQADKANKADKAAQEAQADQWAKAAAQPTAAHPAAAHPTSKKPSRALPSLVKPRKKIAVLVFEGAIIDGTSKQHPLLGQALGAESFIPHIRALEKANTVKGVVLRVNSGGGSATASEDILDALSRLREKKPLVVSMSDVAGSGGYWISCCAERLFAHHSTLTGSIGVITMFFYLEKFLKKHGITASGIKTGPHADLGSVFHSMDEKEREIIDSEVERLYQLFLERVAESRVSIPEEIDAYAKGRVWAGNAALRHNLIDEIGGIESAVAYLRGTLDLPRAKVEFYPRIKHSFLEKRLIQSRSAPAASVVPPTSAAAAEHLLQCVRDYSAKPLVVMPELWGRNLF